MDNKAQAPGPRPQARPFSLRHELSSEQHGRVVSSRTYFSPPLLGPLTRFRFARSFRFTLPFNFRPSATLSVRIAAPSSSAVPPPPFFYFFIFLFFYFLPPVLSTPLARSQCDTMQRSRLGRRLPWQPSKHLRSGGSPPYLLDQSAGTSIPLCIPGQ